MAPEKVTVMILNVDLKCSCCYKKVRKLLCKFPQIRDQVFDEDKNKVMITVVCCDPEKIRDKLCCKGGKAIQSIEIIEQTKPPQPKPADPPKPDPPKPLDPPPKPKPDPPPPKPKVDPPKVDPPKPNVDPPKVDPPKPNPNPPKPKADPPKLDPPKKPDPQPQPQPQPVELPPPVNMLPDPMHGYPPPAFCPPPPVSVCCQECYEGRGGGPCHYGRPVPPPPGPCHDPAYGYGNYGYGYPQYAGNRPCYVTRCDYFSEENPQGCSIM